MQIFGEKNIVFNCEIEAEDYEEWKDDYYEKNINGFIVRSGIRHFFRMCGQG